MVAIDPSPQKAPVESASIPRLRLKAITKRFGTFTANDHISLDVNPGEVMCLLGENGAGKTTLMNVVYGLLHPEEGSIEVDGKTVAVRSPHEAIAHGIGMVHQHFMLVEPLTVTENIVLGTRSLFSKGAVLSDIRSLEEQVREVGNRYGLKVDPSATVANLSVGERQRVEIVKALYRGVKLLILDEPTAVLTPQETTDLFGTLKNLTREGLSVIFISHKMNEVMAVADRITILRDGKVVGRRLIGETNPGELATLMVGRDVTAGITKTPPAPGRKMLVIEDLSVTGEHGRKLLDRISFSVAEGEILGVAGVDGEGQQELTLAIAGILKASSGRIWIGDQEVTGRPPGEIIRAGLRHIPQDRQSAGLVLEFSVADNLILKKFTRPPFVKRGVLQTQIIQEHAREIIKKFDVRTRSPLTPVEDLSGGNQQKVVLGREIDSDLHVLLAAQPTRGLDVGATAYIHEVLLEQRAKGISILLISTELEEILNLSDRIVVLYGGKIMGETTCDRANIQKIGLMMAGMPMPSQEQAA